MLLIKSATVFSSFLAGIIHPYLPFLALVGYFLLQNKPTILTIIKCRTKSDRKVNIPKKT